MMLDIFNNSANPFYRFGQVLFLDKIKKEEWIPFIVDAFQRTGKEITYGSEESICNASTFFKNAVAFRSKRRGVLKKRLGCFETSL